VTECITGLDLVEQMIRVAAGEKLGFAQADIKRNGWAIECRINAEDPARDFAPSPGVVHEASWARGDGIRVDTHIESGARIPPFYDSLLGKIVAHGADRATALARLRAAVNATRLAGVATNLGLHAAILADDEFVAGGVDTGYLARFLGGARG
jgi:acetyl-CoA carboxylase biotin carboxylase subunit